jgi:hypothetical protein
MSSAGQLLALHVGLCAKPTSGAVRHSVALGTITDIRATGEIDAFDPLADMGSFGRQSAEQLMLIFP